MTTFTFPAISISTTGLATESEQQAQTALLTTIDADTGSISTATSSIDSKTPALGQALAAASVPVVLTAAQVSTLTPQTNALTDAELRASPVPVSGPLTDTELRASPVPVSASSLPLPTGAATEATLSSIDGKVPANLTVTSTRLLVDGSGVTQPVSGPLTDTQLRASPVPVSGPLTDTELRATPVPISGTVSATQSGTWTVQPGNTANTTPWLVSQGGRSKANTPAFNDYTTTAVTTSAYVQLVASTTSAINRIEIFDSSGEALYLAVGAAASEVDQLLIVPGGNGPVDLAIPASSRISIKARTATASVGYIIINFYT